MNISKARGSFYFSLLALAACAGNVDGGEATEATSSPLTAETPVISETTLKPILPVLPVLHCVAPAITEYAIPTQNSAPQNIVTGPDGRLWFTEWIGDKIGAFTPSTSTFAETPLTPNSGPVGMSVGPDGNLWFTEMLTSRIGTMSTAGTLLSEFANPSNWASGADDPDYIVAGPNGNLWFTGYAVGQISTSGAITPVSTPTSLVGSLGVVTGPDGNVWFVHQEDGPIIDGTAVRVTPSGAMTPFSLPAGSTAGAMPWGITVGPDGNLWVVGNNIWKLSTSGQVLSTFALSGLPSDDFYPAGIATGSDGDLWFTEFATNQIGRITTSGAVTQWTLGGSTGVSGPNSITLGPDGAMWFTEEKANKIGRITAGFCL